MARRQEGAPGKEARHAAILQALNTDPTVRISVLAARFGVSGETVRRDIEELSAKGVVRRTYGGASVTHAGLQPDFTAREAMAGTERALIGAAAAALVEPGAVLMVDAGSTTARFVRALAMRGVAATLITNSLPAVSIAGEAERLRVLVAPGEFYAAERALYGAETQAFLRRFSVDVAFIGASGLTVEGPTDAESRAAWVKRAMLERAPRRVLLLDSGKFGRAYLERVTELSTLTDLVTDAPPPPSLTAALEKAKVAIHVANDV
ncbi:DeoR/GlpR family DNA-binding transcription regulator [Roseomonas xinghualingensis]|uniref:DeoR/GlpR family DNA-binding transcription regulator n=1 Tax=Roseomonas xinghualingensis TaxID=2986475 RepID=UPI0021F1AF43|nr:DeoR/GlpR family DNA-binding transcription regulator [Roseomonas sp. SXEYE001]MCV4208286.1 DeoR/GlpR family DNA-binding transcription regulator [Roseomonas sp. SXEYE001]